MHIPLLRHYIDITSILEWSVNEYRLQLGRFKGRYVRRCLVRAMYLSASAVGLSSYLGVL